MPYTIAKILLSHDEVEGARDLFATCLTQLTASEHRKLGEMVVGKGIVMSPEVTAAMFSISCKRKREAKAKIVVELLDDDSDID